MLTIILSAYTLTATGQDRPSLNVVLTVAPSSVAFSDEGGTKNITVTAIGVWKVEQTTASWAHANRSGNQLVIKADRNTSTHQRTATVTIRSANKTASVNITQAAATAQEDEYTPPVTRNDNTRRGTDNSYLSISPNNVSIEAAGGSKTFSISSNSSWHISTNTANWGHLTRNGNTLTLRVDANPKNENRTDYFVIRSGNRMQRVNITQQGETTLSLSSTVMLFSPPGSYKSVEVNTNGTWNYDNAASWVHLSKNGNQLAISVDENSGTTNRTSSITVRAGNKSQTIYITQTGETRLEVSEKNLSFSHNGGYSIVNVTSNDSWRIGVGTASWGHAYKSGNHVMVNVSKNKKRYIRRDYFTIKANDKEERVDITQYGRPRHHFNHAWDEYAGGFSVGYIQKQWTNQYDDGDKEKYGTFDDDDYMNGIQAGFRLDPQFGAGFGMNSGLFYEYCWARSDDHYDDYGSYHITYEEHGLYMPLHLKFTMNFSRWFQLSFYGGAGLNYLLSGKAYLRDDGETYGSENVFKDQDNWRRFNTMLEYGAALRMGAVQFDVSMSKGLTNWSDTDGVKITMGRPLTASMTICF